jgi:hypothetical protein
MFYNNPSTSGTTVCDTTKKCIQKVRDVLEQRGVLKPQTSPAADAQPELGRFEVTAYQKP